MLLLHPDSWEIKKTKNKGKGIFARKDISQGIIIGDYLGTFLRPEEALVDELNFYLMYYSDRAVIAPDLNIDGVHLLNNSCLPNACLYIYKGHTLVFALRNIKRNEEITVPYLLVPITNYCNPCKHICLCGSEKCTGSMHLTDEKYKKWKSISEKQASQTKREKISYGKKLKILSDYPTIDKKYLEEVRIFLNS